MIKNPKIADLVSKVISSGEIIQPTIDEELYFIGDLNAKNLRLGVGRLRNGNAQIIYWIDYESDKLQESEKFNFTNVFEHFYKQATDTLGSENFAAAVFMPAGPIEKDPLDVTLSRKDKIHINLVQIGNFLYEKLQKNIPTENVYSSCATGKAVLNEAQNNLLFGTKKLSEIIKGEKNPPYRVIRVITADSELGAATSLNFENDKVVVQCDGGRIPPGSRPEGIESVISRLILSYKKEKGQKSMQPLEETDYVSERGIYNILMAYRDLMNGNIIKLLAISAPDTWKELLLERQKLKNDYLVHRSSYKELFRAIKKAQDPIIATVENISDPKYNDILIVDKALSLFFDMYGRTARNSMHASGCDTLLLGGEIIQNYLDNDKYLKIFRKSISESPGDLESPGKVPVYAIKDKNIGLRGCIYHGADLVGKHSGII